MAFSCGSRGEGVLFSLELDAFIRQDVGEDVTVKLVVTKQLQQQASTSTHNCLSSCVRGVALKQSVVISVISDVECPNPVIMKQSSLSLQSYESPCFHANSPSWQAAGMPPSTLNSSMGRTTPGGERRALMAQEARADIVQSEGLHFRQCTRRP